MLHNILKKDKNNFYTLMNYPKPCCLDGKSFSWKKKNKFLDEYLQFVNKYGGLYKNLPFVKQIFLANSIVFNVLKDSSDIDLLVICKSGRIWLCRTFAYFIFLIFGVSWNFGKKQRKKFDLGFFLTEDNLNLYYISLKPFDRYLAYWIRHLVLLYDQDCNFKHKDKIFAENMWISAVFPDFNYKQSVVLDNKIFCGKGIFKKIIEKIFEGWVGDIFEMLTKYTWGLIILWKKKRMSEKGWGIIISDKMLKFHGKDIRKKINLLMKLKK